VISPDADEELRRLKNEINEVSTALGIKDKTLEEQSIKIELLESRMRDASKKAVLLKELETKFEAVQTRERELLDVVKKQSRDLQRVEAERDDYRTRLEKPKRTSGSSDSVTGTTGFVSGDNAASLLVARENESLRVEIASLQAAVRFLRDDNCRARLLDPSSVQRINNVRSWLDTPLVRPRISDNNDFDGPRGSECHDVLTHLLRLTKDSKFVDLKRIIPPEGANRLAWRPLTSTPRYHILRQREKFEQWSQWKDEIAHRERERARRDSRRNKAPPSLPVQSTGSQLQSEPLEVRIPDRAVAWSDDTKASPTPRSMGVMSRAWRILGMQRDEISKTTSPDESPGEVRIVT
jgi:dynactin 1